MSAFEFIVIGSAIILSGVLGEIRIRWALCDMKKWVRTLLTVEREVTDHRITAETERVLKRL